MIRVQDNPERIESTEEKTGPRLEGDKTGQAQEAFHFLLFFFLSQFSTLLLPSFFRQGEERERVPELSSPRHLNLDDLIMHHLRDRHFAETTLRRLSTRARLGDDWQTSFNLGTCFSLTHAHICLFATGATCFWISVHLHKGRRG